MKRSKLWSLILVTILCLSMLPGAVAETALEGEITFWHSFTQGPRLERIQAAADGFMAENPNVKINIETFSWADFYTKWTTGLASGNVPDMSTAQNPQVVEMIDADAIIPLDGLIDRIGRERFFEAPLRDDGGWFLLRRTDLSACVCNVVPYRPAGKVQFGHPRHLGGVV